MSTLLKSIQKLSWRFSANKAFLPTQDDISSLNEIISWINREKEERAATNQHFGKIVSWAYLNLLRNYNGDKALAEKEIVAIFEMPLVHHYEMIRMQMDAFKDRDAFDVLGITDAFQVNKREDGYRYLDDIRVKHTDNKNLTKEHIDILTEAVKPLEFKYVADNMQFFVTELLNRYADKP